MSSFSMQINKSMPITIMQCAPYKQKCSVALLNSWTAHVVQASVPRPMPMLHVAGIGLEAEATCTCVYSIICYMCRPHLAMDL